MQESNKEQQAGAVEQQQQQHGPWALLSVCNPSACPAVCAPSSLLLVASLPLRCCCRQPFFVLYIFFSACASAALRSLSGLTQLVLSKVFPSDQHSSPLLFDFPHRLLDDRGCCRSSSEMAPRLFVRLLAWQGRPRKEARSAAGRFIAVHVNGRWTLALSLLL